MKEYLGEESVKELFKIIAENFTSKDDFLKLIGVIKTATGAEGGENFIATDKEVEEVLNKYFNGGN